MKPTAIVCARRNLALAILLLAAAETAGCSWFSRPAPRGAALQRSGDLARKGDAAARRGDLAQAIALHSRALDAARSVEDIGGIARERLALATLHRAAGEPAAARDAIGPLLAEPPPLPFPAGRRAEAHLLAALLAADAGAWAEGEASAGRALALCRESACGREGVCLNVAARVRFLAGDPAGAARHAQEGLERSRSEGDRAETANALRILGDAALAGGRAAEAAERYGEALAIDKALGESDKIALDLLGAARAARDRGLLPEARTLAQRALDASRGAGDTRGAAAASAFLESLPAAGP